jgi:hypothetical protein
MTRQPDLCPRCRAKLEPFSAQRPVVKAGIIIFTAGFLGLLVLVAGCVWSAVIEVWS